MTTPSIPNPSPAPTPWYVSAFGEFYEDLYRHRDANDARRAVDFLRRERLLPGVNGGLALRDDAGGGALSGDIREPVPSYNAGGRVLDLCCGAGRHALLLAGEDRARVTGLDLAGNLLAEAQRQAASAGLSLPLVRGDMARLPFRDASFALVVNLFTSFGYFEAEADNRRVLAEIARVLEPGDGRAARAAGGGRAVLDLIHPAWLRAHLVAESERTTPAGRLVREWRRYDAERRRIEKRMEIVSPDGSVRRLMESVRCYEPEEVAAMARGARMRVAAAFGDFDSRPLTGDAPRAIYVLAFR
jgi:ubiquinone/menaquinone biosynthesis C-methylase UbiE